MTVPERDRLIEALDRLGDPDDVTALGAARVVAGAMAEAGLDWDDVLALPVDEEPVEDGPAAAEAQSIPVEVGDSAEALKTIERLLARPGLFEGTRQELAGYRDDIASGDFDAADRRYLAALAGRLGDKPRRGAP
ncbi:MAG: hypothetical protein FJX53_04835 [Alphaproteobacteria bacterium]|nr:hypothetical protein [Alphaproteobacteria bacterium]